MRALGSGLLLGAASLVATLIAAPAQEAFTPTPPQPMNTRDSGVGRLVPNFSGKLLDGSAASLVDGTPRAYVVAMTSASCPISRKYGPSLARLEKECADLNVRLVFVNSSAEETKEEKEAQLKTLGVTAPYFDDSSQAIAQAIGARVTTEVFVLDQDRTLVYRGALDDQYGIGYSQSAPKLNYVRDCLKTLVKGEAPTWNATIAPGCILNVSPEPRPVAAATYSAEVSRIVQRNCISCHHKGGSAPFSLETYDQVKGRAAMIEHVVTKGIMPPWFAEPKGGDSVWKNDMSLRADEKATLLQWIKDGTPEGDPKELPAPLAFDSGWKIGEPDAVFEYPEEFHVPAEGVIDYQMATVPTNFKEDKWIQAIQIIPSAKAVVHHVLVFLRRPGETTGPDGEGIGGYFGIYVPGNDTLIYPDGLAKRIPAGSSLKFQIHYTTNGTPATDRSKVGFKFATKPVVSEVFTGAAVNLTFTIPPGAANHEVVSSFTAPQDIKVLSYLPHMHLRGKAAKYEVINPSGTSETVLDIPRYDFNWQLSYEYKNPVAMAKGTKIKYTAWFDNSENNPANPNPKIPVSWGEQTFNEMQLGYVEYIIPGLKPGQDTETKEERELKNFRTMFDQIDKNHDGVITADELPMKEMFDQADADKDGKVTFEEALKLFRRG
jgi:hypothetical protein